MYLRELPGRRRSAKALPAAALVPLGNGAPYGSFSYNVPSFPEGPGDSPIKLKTARLIAPRLYYSSAAPSADRYRVSGISPERRLARISGRDRGIKWAKPRACECRLIDCRFRRVDANVDLSD